MKPVKRKTGKLNVKRASRILKGLLFTLYSAVICLTTTSVAYASKLQSSTFYTGTKALLDDATKAIGVLAPIVVIIVVVYFFMRKSASDEMDYKKCCARK